MDTSTASPNNFLQSSDENRFRKATFSSSQKRVNGNAANKSLIMQQSSSTQALGFHNVSQSSLNPPMVNNYTIQNMNQQQSVSTTKTTGKKKKGTKKVVKKRVVSVNTFHSLNATNQITNHAKKA